MSTSTTSTAALPWSAGEPYATYEALRATNGVVYFDHHASAWIVLGHAAAREVLRGEGWSNDPAASPSAREQLAASGLDPDMFGRMLLFLDPPDHTRIRGALRSSFTPAAIRGLRERVDAIARATIDPLPAGEPIDAMAEVARPLPVAVISEWMDLGIDGAQLLWAESPALVRTLDLAVEPNALAAAAGSFTALVAHLLPLASERRHHPGDDLLSVLATDSSLHLDEAVVTALVLAIAGHETTANLIGNSLVTLLRPLRGDQYVEPQPHIDEAIVDELLRLDGPVQAVGRTAVADHELAGEHIRTGDRVLVVVAAANRDPDAYRDPGTFDPQRIGPPPLAFGLGRHHCIGATLARLEANFALERLLARRPRLVDDDINWRPTLAIHGPESLTIELAD